MTLQAIQTATATIQPDIRDVAAWNAWRRANLNVTPNLSGKDLSGANLRGVDLFGADVRYAVLDGANLTEANLSRANVCWASMAGADLTDANLYQADVRWADLNGAKLTQADLHWADLSSANMHGVNLSGALLEGTNLYDAKGVVDLGLETNPLRRFRWVVVLPADATGQSMIKAGCRWYTLEDARAHWGAAWYADNRSPQVVAESRARLAFAEALIEIDAVSR